MKIHEKGYNSNNYTKSTRSTKSENQVIAERMKWYQEFYGEEVTADYVRLRMYRKQMEALQ